MRALLLTLLLAGCASGMVPVSEKPVDPRWPLLRTSYWFGTPEKVVEHCYASVPTWAKLTGGVATACAFVDWKAMTCGINVAYGEYGKLGHELSHCYGSTHIGEDIFASWETFLQAQFDETPSLKAFNYIRAADGKTVTVTRGKDGVLRYEVLP